MNRAQVLTPWTTGALGANVPRLTVDHPCFSYVDVTDQPCQNIPPTPNLFTAEVVCDDATLAAIEADPNYSVLWSEPL